MGDGITTCTQKEIAQLQQSYVELNAKVDTGLTQVRSKNQANTEQLRAEMAKVSLDLKQFIVECFQKPSAPIDLTTPSPAPGVLGAANNPLTSTQFSGDSSKSSDTLRSYTKHSKIECPRFEGSDFVGWYHRILQFFEADSTLESSKIRTVMMHLEGRALPWHLHFMRIAGASGQFEIAQQVHLSEPKTLAQVVNYARYVESLFNGSANISLNTMPPTFKTFLNPNSTKQSTYTQRTNTKIPSLHTSNSSAQLLTYPSSKQTSPTEKTSPTNSKSSYIPTKVERDERKKQGLCMWCATKYTPGHRCGVKAQLYQMFLEESTDGSYEQEGSNDSIELTEDANLLTDT
ncbi:hypothetical protein COLO4_24687 [Corchorus olitorius]|uniref:Retrotransposon gag protein n=1 Tax=Corchorus olitorius TaxID=93759 RepID=A0A1R3I7Z5_9ROSI|nr:hypothetical protein COLO4_24687 [Corchorus olitorius]